MPEAHTADKPGKEETKWECWTESWNGSQNEVMNILDLITTSVLGALGCSMDTFLRYFPAAETMYDVFLALALGLILLNWVVAAFQELLHWVPESKQRIP